MFKKIKRYCKDPYFALGCDMIKKHPHWMSDEFYIRTLWRMVIGYELDLKHPKTFNEKLQWLKLYDRNPLYTLLVDKYRVKEYVAERIGAEHVIPTLAVYNSVDEIDLDKLPNQFVLKCNHDSGSVFICKDKNKFEIDEVKKKLGEALTRNFYWEAREWPYKNVKPLIFAETFIEDTENKRDIDDYKVFTFNGEPKLIQVDIDRFTDHHRNIYDVAWRYIEAQIEYPSSPNNIQKKPKQLEKMLDMCRVLCDSIPHARCDFYIVGDKLYFGEITMYHGGGFERFTPNELGVVMGSWIRIEKK